MMKGKRVFNALIIGLIGGWMIQTGALADESQLRETLTKMVDEIEAIKPLLQEAEREQPLHPRVTLHIASWVDGNGKVHAGLRDDINHIQQALIRTLHTVSVEPRVYPAMPADFVDGLEGK